MKSKPYGRPNPGIGQPLPPKPVDKRYNKEATPPKKYEDENRFMDDEDPMGNMTPAEDDEEFGPGIREKLRERRMRRMNGPEDMSNPPPSRSPVGGPPPSRSPMGRRTPTPVPLPAPTPVEPAQKSQNPRQSRLRYKLLERRKNG